MTEIDLSAIAGSRKRVSEKTQKNAKDKEEESSLGQQRQAAALNKIRAEIVAIRYIGRLRQQYANKVFCYLVCYSVGSLLLVLASGYQRFTCFELPPQVLLVIVGSTAASAIGLVGFVVSGLFKNIK